MVMGVERLPPYHYWGYGKAGNKNRDPNYQRSIAKDGKESKEKGKRGWQPQNTKSTERRR